MKAFCKLRIRRKTAAEDGPNSSTKLIAVAQGTGKIGDRKFQNKIHKNLLSSDTIGLQSET